MTDWQEIRDDFLATGTSYPQLAAKYGVSISTLKKKAARERWTDLKDGIDIEALGTAEPEPEEPQEPPLEPDQIIEAKLDRLQRFLSITDGMMDRIQDAIESPDVINPYSLKMLASALRDLREMQGLNRTALDIEEQRLRIEKLRNEMTVREYGREPLVVEFVNTEGAET